MKSMAKTFIQYALVLTLLLSVGAQAESSANAKDYAVFRIDKCNPGSQYAFFLTEHGADINSLSGDSLYYIDQLNANVSEILVAVVFPDITAFDAYVGGVFSDASASPRKLGEYTAAKLPEQMVEIGASAFEGGAFTHVILGGKVKTIGSRAFANCSALVYIYIPESTKTIAPDVFFDDDTNGNRKSVVIGCSSGSAAWNFAKENGIPCKTLD